ncbi:hypothetical protein NEHOM01_0327 [Nematocida homosporus]|uniref:uncharacterized protein n=1 Tax=Nematocida homosporus TaxID=1912981 RepID=UPI002220D952|nr:uncharacterized protein NEHOM01_0327 [Nematocida homosporus]KAI5184725.1 hypothetical protein NEHOM01_0327 [Nematocida homosporus]
MEHTFASDIFSIESFAKPLVVLLDGEIYQLCEGKSPKKLFDLKERVKLTLVKDEVLYICTVAEVYRLEAGQLKGILKGEFEQVSAMDISSCRTYLGTGTYAGNVTMHNLVLRTKITYQEHEDSIVGLVIRNKSFYTASEDGIINRTRIDEEEPRDTFGIGKLLRYLGIFNKVLLVIDAQGSLYTFDSTINDFCRERKVLPGVTEVYPIKQTIYTVHNQEITELLPNRQINKMPYPEMYFEGLFAYRNQLYPYSGCAILKWKSPKAEGEIDDFFEDL